MKPVTWYLIFVDIGTQLEARVVIHHFNGQPRACTGICYGLLSVRTQLIRSG